MTYREARMQAAALLKAAGVENEAAESWFLIEAVCQISRSFYLLHERDEMNPEQEKGLSGPDGKTLSADAVAVSDRRTGIYGTALCGQ